MAGRDIKLFPGVRYYAGVALPWYVPRSVVTSAAKQIGFQDVQWHPREDTVPVDPETDEHYSDDWDSWATGIYEGSTQNQHLNNAPAWIVSDTAMPAAERFPQDQAAQEMQNLVDGALRTNDPATIRQAARYSDDRGWTEVAKTLRSAADRIGSSKTQRVANWAAIGGIVLTTVGIFVATLGFTGRPRRRR